ncbi:uncharacterized protein EI97DRAFT_445795 [Westerdykella ornata]|uniref:Uncharacterized protein n=1 Tax=Westerdykella ornata TaxID=318751 RepID=A0A6A6J902_WESOR|nr:uncharacterized protein EI97DRAFT_445795 [Westerdykella ornata]KAF2272468.1 hypothetical protein EI97DRAFT_445795 [Westerdykella ornata]
MAGNPFRQSQVLSASTTSAAPPNRVSFLDPESSSAHGTPRAHESGTASSSPSTTTRKSVHIEAPDAPTSASAAPPPAPLTADDPVYHSLSSEKDAGPPLPRSPAGFSDHFEDQHEVDWFDKEHSNERIYDVQRGRTINPPQGRHLEAPTQSLSGVPTNPFARTLANIEGSESSRGEREQHRGRGTGSTPEGGAPKANLDVESFKRLLLTGISPPSSGKQTTQATVTTAAPAGLSTLESSSTDTSSVSHQSIVEAALQEPRAETPRTSYEMAPSDEERVGLITEVKKPEKKKQPPPAPKHRHGKLVSSRTPQTVPFADFGASESTVAPVRRRTDSDLNKPLPPIPPVSSPPTHSSSQDITQDTIAATRPPLQSRHSTSSDPTHAAGQQKKIPPPVPLARRQSQLRTSTTENRSRSSSILTVSSQHSIAEFPTMTSSVNSGPRSSPSQKVPPPPPPSRRYGASLSGGASSSANSSATELLPGSRPDITSPNHPSPRRMISSSSTSSPVPGHSGLSRTPSTTSTRTIPRTVSGESTSSAPPPPPPRRRASGRSSLDRERPNYPPSISSIESRRTSSEAKRTSFDGKRRTSIASESSLRYEYAPSTEQEPLACAPTVTEEPQSMEPIVTSTAAPADILHDMEEFQREIDKLRERYQKSS